MSSAKKAAPSTPAAANHKKRPAPTPASHGKPIQSAAKKSKPTATPTPKARAIASDDDEDDDDEEAILRMKAAAASKKQASTSGNDAEEDDFEVAAGSGDEDGDVSMDHNERPSDLDDDHADDESMSDDEEEQKPQPKKKTPPTPSAAASAAKKEAPPSTKKPAAPAPSPKLSATPAKPAPSPKLTPSAAATPSAKKAASPAIAPVATPAAAKKVPVATPAKPATATKKAVSSSDDSETSESEDEAPAPKKSPVPSKPTPATATAAATAARKKVVSDSSDSSESSEDEEAEKKLKEAAANVYKKPQPVRKPTPLQGDASVNPPPKPVKPAAAGAQSSFEKPMSRPPTAPHTGRSFTVSIALPGSIIANAQSKELRTYVAGQIARAAATFNVDEIVVFAEGGKQDQKGIQGNFEGATRSTDPDVFMARILQYLETPQYLRKLLFPKHADLANAGLLNPLDSPHHVRIDEETPYREGVVVNRPVSKNTISKNSEGEGGCWANIGLKTEALIDRAIESGTRVTVHIPQVVGSTTRKQVAGRAVAPSTPREKNGTYWGYTTRLAQSLSQVWSECPFKDGYDLCIGTSEHGSDCHAHDFTLPPFKHVIIFFGGLAGLEEHIAADESISVKTPKELFQMYINSVIGQGCRTIRTEEAVPITLSALYRHIRTNVPPQ